MRSIGTLRRASAERRLCLRKGHGPLSSGTIVTLVADGVGVLTVEAHGFRVTVPEGDLVVRRAKSK